MFDPTKNLNTEGVEINLDEILSLDKEDELKKDFMESLSPASRQQLQLLELRKKKQQQLRDRYEKDIIGYVHNVLGHRPTRQQADVLLQYQTIVQTQIEKRDYELGILNKRDLEYYTPGTGEVQKQWLSVDAGHNIGKCVDEDDWIQLAEGWVVKAKKLINESFRVLTIQDGRPVVSKAFAHFNANEEVFEIKTKSGVILRRNSEHPFFVNGEWVKVKDLSVGDELRTLPTTPCFNGDSLIDLTTVTILGYLCSSVVPLEFMEHNDIRDRDYISKYLPTIVHFVDEDLMLEFISALRTYDDTLGLEKVQEHYYKIVTFNHDLTSSVNSNWPRLFATTHGVDLDDPYNMQIPQTVLGSTKITLGEFVDCVFRSSLSTIKFDGPKDFDIKIHHYSKDFIDQFNLVLRRFGVIFKQGYDKENKVHTLQLNTDMLSESPVYCRSFQTFFSEILKANSVIADLYFYTMEHGIEVQTDGIEYEGLLPDEITSIESVGNRNTIAIVVPETSTFHVYHYEHNTAFLAYAANHFLDMYESMIYCFAPTFDQIKYLFYREFRTLRKNAKLPGTIMENGVTRISENNQLVCRASSDSSGTGTEKAHGMHALYQMHVLDEAEGLEQFLMEAIQSMISGGVAVVLLSRNPKTTSCAAHLIRYKDYTVPVTLSSLDHPNIVHGKNLVPGAVTRKYIEEMLVDCNVVAEHDPALNTIEVPWRPGEIYQPSNEFMWRVLGIASGADAGNKVMALGQMENIIYVPGEGEINPNSIEFKEERWVEFDEVDKDWFDEHDIYTIQMGIDCARFGDDAGTLYIDWVDLVWKAESFYQVRNNVYCDKTVIWVQRIVSFIEYIHHEVMGFAESNTPRINVSIRVDCDGGFGDGVVDFLLEDEILDDMINVDVMVCEVHSNVASSEPTVYDNFITEAYFTVAKKLLTKKLLYNSEALKTDMCLREWETVVKIADTIEGKKKVEPKRLKQKKMFRKTYKRSPDDGDGCVLAVVDEDLVEGFSSLNEGWEDLKTVSGYASRWK